MGGYSAALHWAAEAAWRPWAAWGETDCSSSVVARRSSALVSSLALLSDNHLHSLLHAAAADLGHQAVAGANLAPPAAGPDRGRRQHPEAAAVLRCPETSAGRRLPASIAGSICDACGFHRSAALGTSSTPDRCSTSKLHVRRQVRQQLAVGIVGLTTTVYVTTFCVIWRSSGSASLGPRTFSPG